MLRLVWLALLLATPVILLIPFQDDAGFTKLSALLGAYPAGVADRIYGLIRVAMPWLVTGMLLSQLLPRAAIQGWAILGVALSLLAGLALLPAMGWNEVRELVFTLPGLAAGVWLGERTRNSLHQGVIAHGVARARTEAPAKVESSHPEAPRASQQAGIHVRSDAARMAGRAAASALIMAALLGLVLFPDWRIALALGLTAYGAALFVWPRAPLIVVPAALALFDLAPWSGRFFWDEFDMLMLVTLAVALWQGRLRVSAWRVPKLGGLLAAFLLFWLVSLLVGLFPLQPLDANAFSAYWSHYNSLRLAKGLIWGLMFYGLFRAQQDQAASLTSLSIGMALGVLGVSLWAIWEQALFAGAANTADYRVTAGFSSMHTGGGHIETYLAIGLPFVWGLFFRLRNPLYRACAGGAFLLGTYALFFTVSRGGVIALAVALMVLIPGTWRAHRRQASRQGGIVVPLILGLVTLVVMVAGLSSDFWKQRIAQTGTDAGIRFDHWSEVLAVRDSGVVTALFGQGLGSLPATNLATQLPDKAGSYRYVSDGGNTWLALNSAGTLYMAQRVAPHPGQSLRLELSVRAPRSQTGLEASLCEKILFNSLRCQWMKVDFESGTERWQNYTHMFNSGEVGSGNFLTRRPVQFSFYNTTPGTVVEIDNVRLLDEQGENLLKNGNFTRGGDFWFFKSGDHLFWHAKNLGVHLLFEQGWLGVILFSLILMLALLRLARSAVRGELAATVVLASTAAWSILGGVDSLIDAPRIALLVYGTLFIGAAWGARQRTPTGHSGRRRHHPRQPEEPRGPPIGQG